LQVTIEKMIYGGDGLARLPSAEDPRRGKAVFVPFVLEGERVEAALTEHRSGFSRARAERVLEGSPHRVDPPCPYFYKCGGCQYQHSSYPHQLEIKAGILRETLRRTAKLELASEIQVHAAHPWHYRNRTRMRVRTAPEFALGYNRLGSRELLPVRECPISSPLINRAIAAVWVLGEAGKIGSAVREIEFFADAEDQRLMLEVYADDVTPANETLNSLAAVLPEAIGILALLTGRETSSREAAGIARKEFIYRTGRAEYRVSAGSFFQANRFLTDTLLGLVCDGRSGRRALDLYAGVGLFSLPLARTFEKVTAVESSPASFADLKHNAPANLKPVFLSTDQYLRDAQGQRADLIVLDPPRSGLSERVIRSLLAIAAPRLTYVSCNPTTLSRDLQALLAGGYQIGTAHLIDLFPQTFHIETVFDLVR
jgi:23S rRNA (uracil1939-C5)-methyltransferase